MGANMQFRRPRGSSNFFVSVFQWPVSSQWVTGQYHENMEPQRTGPSPDTGSWRTGTGSSVTAWLQYCHILLNKEALPLEY